MKSEADKLIVDPSISFYDEIAVEYDELMLLDSSNALIRESMAERFTVLVQSGRILDFGGGTGLDLEWLSLQGYYIYFCEPSEAMRAKAIQYSGRIAHQRHIRFLAEGQTDFKTWDQNPPFQGCVDAVLANFAVLNCIADLPLLFSRLAVLLRPGGHLLALVLNQPKGPGPGPKIRQLISSVRGKSTMTGKVNYHAHQHEVYYHSLRKIKNAASDGFHFQDFRETPGNTFLQIHCTRK